MKNFKIYKSFVIIFTLLVYFFKEKNDTKPKEAGKNLEGF